MQTKDAISRWLLAAVFATVTAQASAQSLIDVSVAVQGEDVVAHVLFSGSVRVVQQSTEAPSRFVQIQIELLQPELGERRESIPAFRRVPANGSAPEFTLETNYSAPQSLINKSAMPNEVVTTMNLRLAQDTEVRARQGANPRTIDIVLIGKGKSKTEEPKPAGGVAPAMQETADAVEPLASPEVEARATELMAQARESVTLGKTQGAIGQLNQLLLLPPNSSTQDAQEMIGVAWERAGDLARARMEYELYLKLFSKGEGAQRVAQRLASMGVSPARAEAVAGSAAAATPGPAKAPELKYNGNIAQYYFGGKSRSQSLVNLITGIDQTTLTKTTESAMVTNVDLGARYTTEESDIRAALRGTGSVNLVQTSKNTSILNAAFVDYRQKSSGMAVRVGRQSPINGGLLGLFDGVSFTYPVRDGVRVNLMGGVPASPLVSTPDERLFAGMVEMDTILPGLSGDMYILNQTTEGYTNRRTIGTEARYSDERGSLYALLDYDQLFRAVNAFSVQGSMQGPGQTTFTLLLDTRKAPSLQMTNALISSGATSLKAMVQMLALTNGLSESDALAFIRDTAKATTAQARQLMLSASRPFSEKWQVTGDFRFSDIGALPAVGNFDATPATGAQYGLSMQLTGSNIYSKRDINNFNLSVLSTPLFHGVQLAYNNLTGFDDNKFTLEPSLRLYTQRDTQGVSMKRVSPGLRSSYNVSKRISVMGEGLVEHSTNQGPTNHDSTNSVFFYLGMRYELF